MQKDDNISSDHSRNTKYFTNNVQYLHKWVYTIARNTVWKDTEFSHGAKLSLSPVWPAKYINIIHIETNIQIDESITYWMVHMKNVNIGI